MHTSLHKLSAETLLALGGAIIFFCFGVYLYQASADAFTEDHPVAEVEDGDVEQKSFFELGQFYFNHDDEPGGPYDLELAQFYYEKAIAQDPGGDPMQWYQSGRIDFLEGDFDEALRKFDKQLEHFGDQVPNVYYMIGLTYGYKARITGEAEDWKKGEEAFETFISYFPEAPWSRVDLAWIYFSQGKFEEMKPVLEEGMRYESNNPWLLNMYGLALYNTGDTAMAYEYFTFALELAQKLTVEDWGKSYPGNNPELWGEGLEEFRSIIQKNIALAQ